MNKQYSVYITLLICFLTLGSSTRILAQLPPTLHRVGIIDSAVDIKDVTLPFHSTEWGTCLDGTNCGIILKGSPDLNRRPLTVELLARINSIDKFNIFVAHEAKSSPRHWEFYTFAGSGKLSLYIPGNPSGDTLQSSVALKPGQWYWLGLVMAEKYAEIFIDGVSAGKILYDRKSSETPANTPFGIGSLVNGELNCQGLLDELRISSGIRPLSPKTLPTKPFLSDDQTLLLCHFDKKNVSGESSGESSNSNSVIKVRLQSKKSSRFPDCYDDLIASQEKAKPGDIGSFRDLAALYQSDFLPLEGKLASINDNKLKLSNRLDLLFPTAGLPEVPEIQTEKPVRNVPIQRCDLNAFRNRTVELGLKSISAMEFRAGVFEHWGEEYVVLNDELTGKILPPRGAADQVYDKETLVYPDKEKHPVQVVLRRTKAMAEMFRNIDELTEAQKTILDDLEVLSKRIDINNKDLSDIDFFLATALRRKLMFSNSELNGFDRIMFVARGTYAGSRLTNKYNQDRTGGHFATQVLGFNTIHGGGLFTITKWQEREPVIKDIIKDRKITATKECDRLAGKKLDYGSFMNPELSYDGKTIYFSHCGSREHRWFWSPDTTWNIFKTDVDGNTIEQLTDSAYNDFDVCELPSGRLVFCSERRGGFIRCFAESARLQVTTSVLHSMKNDGSDIYPISYYETSEWQPSVDNHGMLVYTRWDYTDRENCLGSTFWTANPDGRNPRSPHGNYPFPWHSFEDNRHGDHRFGQCPDSPSALPMTEMQIRAIPDSHRYIFTAAPHHGETFGSLCILDLRLKNDFHMSQVRRLTPYSPFPESEMDGRSQYQYSAPWPINEDLWFCNSWENLILMDRFGNDELICERELLPIGYDARLRLSEPVPVIARQRPPIIPQQTSQGCDFADKNQQARIGIINVNHTDLPFPSDRKPSKIRVFQVIVKPNPWMNIPNIGYATENTPRIPLGVAPIEKDGSAYFEVPSGKQLLFQVLDDRDMAIQTMRSATFTHAGEQLVCTGCHEHVDETIQNTSSLPLAFNRKPSKLIAECNWTEPLNFYRQIQPILEKRCLSCHVEKKKGPQTTDYESLRPYVYFYSGGMRGTSATANGIHGGSRSIPGRVGAFNSKLSNILNDKNHLHSVSNKDRHLFILWMDGNAPRLGAFVDEEAQKRGELVWPILDTDNK